MADKDVNSVITTIENEIRAAEAEVARLVAEGEQEALKIEEAVVARLKALLSKIMSALGA
jgi:hypothetical protein